VWDIIAIWKVGNLAKCRMVRGVTVVFYPKEAQKRGRTWFYAHGMKRAKNLSKELLKQKGEL
jgi:hypothetical protein